MDRCDFYSDEEYRQALEIQEQEYREEIALEQEIQDFGYYEYLLNKFTGLTPNEIVKLKSQLTEAMELLKNSAPFANSYSGWWSIQKYQDRYEKLKNEVEMIMTKHVE